jgi:hypothetical protein
LLLVCAVGFVAVGAFIVRHARAGDEWKGWLSIVFFGACIPLFAWQLVDARPRLVIDDHGVLDRTLGVGVIPWTEIVGAQLHSIQGHGFISLKLRDEERWKEKLSPIKRAMIPANEALGFSAFNLNLSAIAAEPSDVLELILKGIASQPGEATRTPDGPK